MDNSRTALVVDNSPVIRRIVASVLEKEGWEVLMAENGLEAIDQMNRKQPAIVFTDLIMPKIDGEKLSYIIRSTKQLADIFIVVLSGVAMEDDQHTIQIGADVCIAKGPAGSMRKHILASLEKYHSGDRAQGAIKGVEELYPREVTSELLISKRHNDIILANIVEGVFELNHDGRIVMVNQAGVALCEVPEAEILGMKFQSLLEEKEKQEFEQWLCGNESFSSCSSLDYSYDHPACFQGKIITLHIMPLKEEGKNFYICLVKDITARKILEKKQQQLEKEIKRIQKIDAMSVMAGGIAHDFNNLLTIINGNIEMARYLSNHGEVGTLLEEAVKALDLTVQLIRKFSIFSTNYLPQKFSVNLHDLITQTLEVETEGTSVTWQINEIGEYPKVYLDPVLLQQVFANLTLNAIEAMPDGGCITVDCELIDAVSEIERTDQPIPEGRHVHISFRDTGIGIPAEHLDIIFDPYYSTKQKGAQKGMGLGLTIVHSIIIKHGGMVWVESEVGKGSCIHLYLPADEHKSGHQGVLCPDIKVKRVLVMDDDEMMLQVYKKMFAHFLCDVITVHNGEEAITYIQNSQAEDAPFDLILLDLRVEKGMGGLLASKKIRNLLPKVRQIAVSGDSTDDVIQNYKQYGFDEALAKPFAIETIEQIVRRFVYTGSP
ncbi:ATP-binding response regulator [Desulfogranum japonicum]|uniref:ATP-binding response regulator n=1 Tax=Desulfogranum japonicum TaxID=231447 RepID=UPI000402FCF5|nr:response regulator [Desulfogranum japonicum]